MARTTNPDLKVLFITGYAESSVIGEARWRRGMQVITKPFAMTELGDKVRRMLDAPAG